MTRYSLGEIRGMLHLHPPEGPRTFSVPGGNMDFQHNVQFSFAKVKADFIALKHNLGEWIRNLHGRQSTIELKLSELEARISELEQKLIKLY